ncbi:hypothetical protein ACFTXM_14940 [Streptomyces sp. NPDC056930]|uniref:hypothetical protein n=1 Tax=Streptomyces sp. NPDC056930 TaxID=3345967 RepID=UPI003631B129
MGGDQLFDLAFQCLEAGLAIRRLVGEFADEFGGALFAGRHDAVGLCGVYGGVRQGLRHGLFADAVPAQVAGDARGSGALDLARGDVAARQDESGVRRGVHGAFQAGVDAREQISQTRGPSPKIELSVCRSLTRCLDLRWAGDPCRCCELVAVIEGGEAIGGGMDSVFGCGEELADAADAPLDGFGGDGDRDGR